jgi:thiol-disulfide isomerase/thioredoxin
MDNDGKDKKSHKMLYIGIGALVVVLVAYFIIRGTSGGGETYGQLVGAAELSKLSQIANNNTLANNVGITAYEGLDSSLYFVHPANTIPLIQNSKPVVLYIGADYCPYCAEARWPLILALMRFGNLSNITYTASSATDSFPDTPTFSFVNYSYSSGYLSFQAFELQDRAGKPLQNLTGVASKAFDKYSLQGSIPFLDFGNSTAQSGIMPPASPSELDGQNWAGITSQLGNANSSISEEVIGAANIYTAEICKMLNNTAQVCSQNYVKQAQKAFFS